MGEAKIDSSDVRRSAAPFRTYKGARYDRDRDAADCFEGSSSTQNIRRGCS